MNFILTACYNKGKKLPFSIYCLIYSVKILFKKHQDRHARVMVILMTKFIGLPFIKLKVKMADYILQFLKLKTCCF